MSLSLRFSTSAAAALSAVALAGCAAGALPSAVDGRLPPPVSAEAGSSERAALNARVWDAAVEQVERLYYDPAKVGPAWAAEVQARRPDAVAAPDEATFYRRLHDLLETLDDRHTNAQGPTIRGVSEIRRRGEASVQYGIVLVRVGDAYVIEEVRPDSPAEAAGIQPGWRLISFNDIEAGETTLIAAEDRQDRFVFEDETGARRELTLSGRVLDGRAPREIIRRDDGVVVLRFNGFDIASRDWLRERVAEFQTEPPKAVILDLRSNGGGRLDVLGDVVGLFFGPRRDFAVMTGRFADRPVRSGRRDLTWSGPTAVLTGPGSASASELLAAAFQENDRGPVVGRPTAGAVIASRDFNLPDGGELSVSIRAILTADRQLLEKAGVTPDVAVETPLADRRARRDLELDAAIRALNL